MQDRKSLFRTLALLNFIFVHYSNNLANENICKIVMYIVPYIPIDWRIYYNKSGEQIDDYLFKKNQKKKKKKKPKS